LGRTVAIRSDVVADILNPVGEKFTLLQLKSDTVYFIKTEQTHSKYARRVSKDMDHKRIPLMMVLPSL